jgi:hypothetical protein
MKSTVRDENSTGSSDNEKEPSEAGPDSAKSPIKQSDPLSVAQPEIPKVGTADAPGG